MLYAAWEYRDILAEPKKKKLVKPRGGQANKVVLFKFALLTKKLGVRIREINNLL